MNVPSEKGRWEEFVTHLIKTIDIIGFIFWRFVECEVFLETQGMFLFLEALRNRLSKRSSSKILFSN